MERERFMFTKEEKKFAIAVGDNLRRYRKSSRLTQAEVYARTSIFQNTISDYEHGRRNASLIRLYRLAKCYGCEVSDLIRTRKEW